MLLRKLALRIFILSGLVASAPLLAEPCGDAASAPSLERFYSHAWGYDARNTRYQPDAALHAGNVGSLRLKWVYGLAGNTPRSYPLVTEDTVFMGDPGRGVVALDRETGCERWLAEHDGYISSAILPVRIDGRQALLYNDRIRGIYAIDARDGSPIWHAEVTDEPLPWYSGTPLVVGERVFVPVASQEVGLAFNPFYGCCTTSGGMAAFDVRTGSKLWYRPTIEAPAQKTGSHWWFVSKFGPSGAPVWGAPSFDAQRNLLYFGTGQNYSHPTTDTSNALFALHADTGEIAWRTQFTPNDAYTAACNILPTKHPNCPDPPGPDVDFGAATVLTRNSEGRQMLVAGQKSAEVHAVDASNGERLWTTRLGRGGIIGGVHWGLAVDENRGLVFAPNSDKKVAQFPSPGEPEPGLYALDLDSGDVRWHYSRASRCDEEPCVYGLSSAITAANDVVVTGSMDGYLEIYASDTGERLWAFDAWRDFDAVNGVPTSGGAFDAHGPMLADDLLLVTAGYGYVGRQRGGNAFLVFEVDESYGASDTDLTGGQAQKNNKDNKGADQ